MKWVEQPIEWFCSTVASGGTPSTKRDEYYGGDIPWLRTQEVTFEPIRDTEIKITERGLSGSAAKWVPENSVIVAMYGASAGRVAINKIPLTTNQACCNLILDKERADYRYVYYALRCRFEALEGLAKGAAQRNLNAGQVKVFRIPAPTLIEQQCIASILSAYDDLIENNRRRIQLLEQSARLLYKEWFVHLRFPGHEHVKITDGVPEGWERKKLGEITSLNYGKALKESDREPGPFPVYGSSGIIGSHVKALISGPVIIVGRKGNVGSVFWSSEDCHPIDTVFYIAKNNSSFFLYHALQQVTFISTDVAVPGLNRGLAQSHLFLLPEQRIFNLFEEIATLMQMQVDTLSKVIVVLTKARDLLLPRLMNGEVTL